MHILTSTLISSLVLLSSPLAVAGGWAGSGGDATGNPSGLVSLARPSVSAGPVIERLIATFGLSTADPTFGYRVLSGVNTADQTPCELVLIRRSYPYAVEAPRYLEYRDAFAIRLEFPSDHVVTQGVELLDEEPYLGWLESRPYQLYQLYQLEFGTSAELASASTHSKSIVQNLAIVTYDKHEFIRRVTTSLHTTIEFYDDEMNLRRTAFFDIKRTCEF